jgi:hypothetical protein
MDNLLDAVHDYRPLWLPLLVPVLAAAVGLAFIAWGGFSIFSDNGFSW